jgi:glycosyltransferase involved in cell wall biosynthesis
MRLLIVTQKVDKNDAVLGFFHRWLVEFAKHYEHVTVICLGKGEYDLPENVSVYSLGKEVGASRLTYLVRFYSYIWRFRNDYDAVFVHMNPEYIVLAGWYWKLTGKRSMLWYNHFQGGLWARIAGWFADVIFYTSPFSFFSSYTKSLQMGVGIDTMQFGGRSTVHARENALFSLGRIAPIKNIELLIDALLILNEKNFPIEAHIYGNPGEKDSDYYNMIRFKAKPLEQKGVIVFHKGVPHDQTPEIYRRYSVFINLTNSGSFDKTIIEAMASETLVLVSNRSFENLLPRELLINAQDKNEVAEKIARVTSLPIQEKIELGRRLRKQVENTHDIRNVIAEIVESVQG